MESSDGRTRELEVRSNEWDQMAERTCWGGNPEGDQWGDLKGRLVERKWQVPAAAHPCTEPYCLQGNFIYMSHWVPSKTLYKRQELIPPILGWRNWSSKRFSDFLGLDPGLAAPDSVRFPNAGGRNEIRNRVSVRGDVLGSSGCQNKCYRLGGLNNNNLFSYGSWGWEVQDQGTSQFDSWWELSFWLADSHLFLLCFRMVERQTWCHFLFKGRYFYQITSLSLWLHSPLVTTLKALSPIQSCKV